MENLKNLEEIVKRILTAKPSTRGSDEALYKEVCEAINPIVCQLPFSSVLDRVSEFDLPHFSSVERARRRVQQNHKELRPSERVTDNRFKKWKAVREYVTQ